MVEGEKYKKNFKIGDILEKVIRREGLDKRKQSKKQEVRKILKKVLGSEIEVGVIQVRAGVLLLETNSAALFQELEGFKREALLEALRAEGQQIGTLRVKLTSN